MTATSKLVRTVRLDDEAIQKLVVSLEESTTSADIEKRKAARYAYRAKGCILHAQSQGGGPPASYLMTTRDLSDTGMSFLHGAFLYPGAKVVVQMTTIHGMWQNVPAEVVRCNYVASGVHEVGLKFLKQIDASEFCTDAVRCRVLIVDDNPSIIRFVQLILTKLNADCEAVNDGESAIKLALSNVYDLILLDMEMPGISGFETVKKLRAKGYSGKIVAATGLARPGDEQACIDAGCNSYIAKPLSKDQLSSVLRSLRKEPLRSSLTHDPSMFPLIDEFVSNLPKAVREIEAAFAGKDMDGLQTLCRNLKAEAGSFGFEPITAAAGAVEQALIEKKSATEIGVPFRALVDLCCQARGSSTQ